MLGIQAAAKGARTIQMDVIVDNHAAHGRGDLPLAGLGIEHHGWRAGRVPRANIFYVGSEVAHLVERVPHRHVERANAGTLRQANAHVGEVLGQIG